LDLHEIQKRIWFLYCIGLFLRIKTNKEFQNNWDNTLTITPAIVSLDITNKRNFKAGAPETN
jgi:hypothetical protein